MKTRRPTDTPADDEPARDESALEAIRAHREAFEHLAESDGPMSNWATRILEALDGHAPQPGVGGNE